MQQQDMLSRAERLPLMLRTLYEQYGYQRYSMGKFEPYDLYRETSNIFIIRNYRRFFPESQGFSFQRNGDHLYRCQRPADGAETGCDNEHRQKYAAGDAFAEAVLQRECVPDEAG